MHIGAFANENMKLDQMQRRRLTNTTQINIQKKLIPASLSTKKNQNSFTWFQGLKIEYQEWDPANNKNENNKNIY